MRTSHEWYLKINSYSNPSMMNDVEREWIEKKIIEIQKEAIEECAEQITDSIFTADSSADIKEGILSLINELK